MITAQNPSSWIMPCSHLYCHYETTVFKSPCYVCLFERFLTGNLPSSAFPHTLQYSRQRKFIFFENSSFIREYYHFQKMAFNHSRISPSMSHIFILIKTLNYCFLYTFHQEMSMITCGSINA